MTRFTRHVRSRAYCWWRIEQDVRTIGRHTHLCVEDRSTASLSKEQLKASRRECLWIVAFIKYAYLMYANNTTTTFISGSIIRILSHLYLFSSLLYTIARSLLSLKYFVYILALSSSYQLPGICPSLAFYMNRHTCDGHLILVQPHTLVFLLFSVHIL